MISQTVEYALRAVTYLARTPGVSATTEEVASATRVPPSYLAKVLANLAKAGVIRSQRGVRGGVMLERDPADLSMLEVIQAVDPIPRYRKCPLGLAAHGVKLCPLHDRLDAALASVEDAFRRTTLAEVLAEPAPGPQCDFPERVAAPERSSRTAGRAVAAVG